MSQSTSFTKSQMLIWTGQKISPADPLYNMIFSFEIEGKIVTEAFQEAFAKVVNENEVLRSSVSITEDIPRQVYHSRVENPLVFYDFSNSVHAYQDYLDWVAVNKRNVFEIDELLYQAVLFKLHDTKFIFYFNQHHLITDAWSTQKCYDALNGHYQNILKTHQEPGKSTYSFKEYAAANPFKYQEQPTPYWQSKSDLAHEPLALYGLRPKSNSSKATRVNFDLGKDRTEKLYQLTLEDGIRSWTPELALSNLFLTALATLLYKVGNKEEFAIGVPFHNRTTKAERNIVGLLMELLPTHIEIDEEATLFGLYLYMKNESLDVVKNAMVGKPPIDLLSSFNVVMNFTPTTFNDFAGLPTQCHWLLSDHVDANHHIRLQIHDFNKTGSFQLLFDFIDAVFPKNQMDDIGRHYIQVIDALIENKDQKIKELSIITETEVKQLKEWNNTEVTYGTGETLLSKFEKQVQDTPKRVAVRFKNRQLTYAQLDEKSNQVAHFLIKNKVRKNDIVAVSLERSIEMMVYIYGILKAGAAYLPIDVLTPTARLNFILENAKTKILLLNHDKIQKRTTGITICYHQNTIEQEISAMDSTRPEVMNAPEDLAYVIYTSGSTGAPKGVKCHHRGICNRLNWMNEAYPISENDMLIQKTPITFDVSVWELFWPLRQGAGLVILEPDEHKDPERLIQAVVDHDISVIHFVPSMLNIFNATQGVDKCRSLKRIFCSGEVLSVSAVKKTHHLLDAEVYNLYGPTEASVDVSHWHCKRGEVGEHIPIGYPVANTQLYILDNGLNRVPIGAIGELYITGLQVAHGYLNNEVLTKERFVQDVFSLDENAIMYRTGDLARYRHDGAIDYLGRIDTQVKLRGQRIELGEIEKTIERLEGITQVIVQLGKTKTGEAYLVAHYTGQVSSDEDIIAVLERSLPSYMIPSFFVHLEEFELLSNGKINRKKIPVHSIEKEKGSETFQAPTNEFEEIVANTWMEILKLDRVGVDENFIRLGGNSLNAMTITSRLKNAFELDLAITLVFDYPTVRTYAAYVKKKIIELLSQ